MTTIGPYVVVFWTLSRLVLVRKGCDAAFLLYSQSNLVEQVVTCSCVQQSLVTVPAGYNLLASLTFFGCSPVIELNSIWTLVWKLSPAGRGDQVIWAHRSTWPLVQPCLIGNKGGTLHRSFLGPKPVDSAFKRLQHNMGQSRSSVLLQERNGAFSDILHTNSHLVGRSHPVLVEVREFDWD